MREDYRVPTLGFSMLTGKQYQHLPQEMRDRMPAAYIIVLKLPFRSSTEGDELHRAVMDLVLSYDFNYSLVFPEINHVPELVQFAKELALPSKSHPSKQ